MVSEASADYLRSIKCLSLSSVTWIISCNSAITFLKFEAYVRDIDMFSASWL